MCLFLIFAIHIFVTLDIGRSDATTNTTSYPSLLKRSDVVAEIRLLRQLVNQETLIRIALQNKVTELRHSLRMEIRKCKTFKSEKKGGYGEIYTRWGKSYCRNGSQLIYSGKVGGSDNYKQSGAAVDHLCLPPDPIYGVYDPNINHHAYVFGAEYDMWNIDIKGTLFDKTKYTTKGVPCAVCRPTAHNSVIMIPGRNACYKGMTVEYRGYLMAGYHSHVGASEYICVDGEAGAITPEVHQWKKILYPVESMCGGPMDCPPYKNGAEMTCVVCSI